VTIDSLDRNPVQPAPPVESVDANGLLDRLVGLSRKIEAHRMAIYLIEAEQSEMRARLRASGWQPPNPGVIEGKP
jgi:hypothetical protein